MDMDIQELRLNSEASRNALNWIAHIFEKNQIIYQISGGLAGKVYGATRPLMDIDIDLSNQDLLNIQKDIEPYIIFGPGYYKKDSWSFTELAILEYEEQSIELCGSEGGFLFSKLSQEWIPYEVDLSTRMMLPIEEKCFPVVNITKLIKYKSELCREVDLFDIQSMQLSLKQLTKSPRTP